MLEVAISAGLLSATVLGGLHVAFRGPVKFRGAKNTKTKKKKVSKTLNSR